MEGAPHIGASGLPCVSHRQAGFLSGSFSLFARKDKLWDQFP